MLQQAQRADRAAILSDNNRRAFQHPRKAVTTPPPPPPTHPHNYFGDRQEANAGSAIVTVPADPIISCAAWLSWMLQSYQGEAMQ